jgi:outer membrane protein W
MHSIDIDGTETTRTSGQKNTGSHSEDVTVPEFFIETYGNSVSLGLSYIPTRDMGSKSRTDTGDQSAGTYKAAAELDNVVQVYADYSVYEYAGAEIYVKAGLQHATIVTLESLNSGSTYPNQDVFGYTLGIGAKGDLPIANTFYKADLTYTDFETYSAADEAGTGNKVDADLEDVAVKLSIGYKF